MLKPCVGETARMSISDIAIFQTRWQCTLICHALYNALDVSYGSILCSMTADHHLHPIFKGTSKLHILHSLCSLFVLVHNEFTSKMIPLGMHNSFFFM